MYSSTHSCEHVVDGRDAMVAFQVLRKLLITGMVRQSVDEVPITLHLRQKLLCVLTLLSEKLSVMFN